MTKELMKVHMLMAMAREENQFPNGDINWDYVDSDVYMDLYGDVDPDLRDDQKFYQYFDELAYELRYAELSHTLNLMAAKPTGVYH